MKSLYIDGCINRSTSRTERLAQAFLQHHSCGTVITEILEDSSLTAMTAERLALRDRLIEAGDYTHPMFRFAHQFAEADEFILAAPYWDMSFPASVKLYLEQICINGLTFRYTQNGCPEGLTKIRKATYITTAGGYIGTRNFGFDYVKGLLQGLFGIPEVQFFCAEGVDIQGNDPEKILSDASKTFCSPYNTVFGNPKSRRKQ